MLSENVIPMSVNIQGNFAVFFLVIGVDGIHGVDAAPAAMFLKEIAGLEAGEFDFDEDQQTDEEYQDSSNQDDDGQ